MGIIIAAVSEGDDIVHGAMLRRRDGMDEVQCDRVEMPTEGECDTARGTPLDV